MSEKKSLDIYPNINHIKDPFYGHALILKPYIKVLCIQYNVQSSYESIIQNQVTGTIKL